VRGALETGKIDIPKWLSGALNNMAAWLEAVVEADGSLPQFNDAADGIAPPAEELLKKVSVDKEKNQNSDWQGERENGLLLPDTGLFIVRNPKMSLTFDCGRLGPDFLMAHAHNDMLSFTLSLNGLPIIADSGVYEYEKGVWRDCFRSTKAHSTIQIDDVEQNETWAQFRVARRGYPVDVRYNEQQRRISAGTTCYRHAGAKIERSVTIADDYSAITIKDRISNKKRKERRVTTYFQIASGLTVDIGKSQVVIKKQHSIAAILSLPDNCEVRCEEGWESREFGVKEKRVVLAILSHLPNGIKQFNYTIKSDKS
jgi:uncharacterized heparinase superfamily protein